jgi:hypothetical protein
MQRSIVPASSGQSGYQEPLTDLGPCLQGMNLTLYFGLFLVPCDLQIIIGSEGSARTRVWSRSNVPSEGRNWRISSAVREQSLAPV